jgi:hypothetical protein
VHCCEIVKKRQETLPTVVTMPPKEMISLPSHRSSLHGYSIFHAVVPPTRSWNLGNEWQSSPQFNAVVKDYFVMSETSSAIFV